MSMEPDETTNTTTKQSSTAKQNKDGNLAEVSPQTPDLFFAHGDWQRDEYGCSMFYPEDLDEPAECFMGIGTPTSKEDDD